MKLEKYMLYEDEMGNRVTFAKRLPVDGDSVTTDSYTIRVNGKVVASVYGEPDEKLAVQMIILYGEAEE